ncbi:28150_t:CDS:2 [Gigaspora margarita]|uniref:28150_t:CDS:1 n=1 Tax=Gigaspora margarita TaxID=4874 RepID=A0ABN7UUP5_GIGMA|nr:28150_t:CDS:2 [Gigaspora margarita]
MNHFNQLKKKIEKEENIKNLIVIRAESIKKGLDEGDYYCNKIEKIQEKYLQFGRSLQDISDPVLDELKKKRKIYEHEEKKSLEDKTISDSFDRSNPLGLPTEKLDVFANIDIIIKKFYIKSLADPLAISQENINIIHDQLVKKMLEIKEIEEQKIFG